MTIFAAVIDKERLRTRYTDTRNPYRVALHFCMERLHVMLSREGQYGRSAHGIFESRGRKEVWELELEFRRIAGNDSGSGCQRRRFVERLTLRSPSATGPSPPPRRRTSGSPSGAHRRCIPGTRAPITSKLPTPTPKHEGRRASVSLRGWERKGGRYKEQWVVVLTPPNRRILARATGGRGAPHEAISFCALSLPPASEHVTDSVRHLGPFVLQTVGLAVEFAPPHLA